MHGKARPSFWDLPELNLLPNWDLRGSVSPWNLNLWSPGLLKPYMHLLPIYEYECTASPSPTLIKIPSTMTTITQTERFFFSPWKYCTLGDVYLRNVLLLDIYSSRSKETKLLIQFVDFSYCEIDLWLATLVSKSLYPHGEHLRREPQQLVLNF